MTPSGGLRRALPGWLVLLGAWCLPGSGVLADPGTAPRDSSLTAVLHGAAALEPLETVMVARGGRIVVERAYDGHSVDAATNIKSASKTILAALAGMAIDRGVLAGVDQPIAPVLAAELPADPDPRLEHITVGHLLSMQAGLQRTSGPHYGRWILSDNWVRAALAQPFVDDPGGRMLYSTGSSHLLSAVLTRTSGRTTLALAREWLGPLDGFRIEHWQRDPQGVHLGGNQMSMTPRSLLAFGELFRNQGRTRSGRRLLSADWIARSWTPRTRSRFTGDAYGYGWFLRRIGGHDVAYAWGYGGQMLYVVPELALTVVMTSDHTRPAGRTGHRSDLHALLGEIMTAVSR